MDPPKNLEKQPEENGSDLDSVYSDVYESNSLLNVYKKISDRVSRLTIEAKQLRQTVVADLGKDFSDMESTLQKSEKEMDQLRETARHVCRELEVESYVEDMIKRLENYGKGLRRVVYHVDDVYQKVFVSDAKKKSKFKSPPTPLGLDLKRTPKKSGKMEMYEEAAAGNYIPTTSRSEPYVHDDSMQSLRSFFMDTDRQRAPKPLVYFDKGDRPKKRSEKVWMERYGGIREDEIQEETEDFGVD